MAGRGHSNNPTVGWSSEDMKQTSYNYEKNAKDNMATNSYQSPNTDQLRRLAAP